jgi:hypothetical protein
MRLREDCFRKPDTPLILIRVCNLLPDGVRKVTKFKCPSCGVEYKAMRCEVSPMKRTRIAKASAVGRQKEARGEAPHRKFAKRRHCSGWPHLRT